MSAPPLPAARVPFPVEAPYRTRPDLRKASQPYFAPDAGWPRYLSDKLHLLRSVPERVRVVDPQATPEALRAAADAAAHAVAQAAPSEVRREGEGWRFPRLGLRALDVPDGVHAEAAEEAVSLERAAAEAADFDPDEDSGVVTPLTLALLRDAILAHLQDVPGHLRLADLLALALQEDLVVLRSGPDGDRAELLHVCFPSHWDPAERAGATLAELHGPVPHGERLRDASDNLGRAMREGGPFERWLWSLHPVAPLHRHPAAPAPAWPSQARGMLDGVAFRVERQSTHALEDGDRSLFAIRVHVAPLREVLAEAPGRAARLAEAIGGMDGELLRYKGLAEPREPLLAALRARAAGETAA